MPNPDPVWAREYRDTREAEQIRTRQTRPHLVTLNADPCVYCGLRATQGSPATCWAHRDLLEIDPNYEGAQA